MNLFLFGGLEKEGWMKNNKSFPYNIYWHFGTLRLFNTKIYLICIVSFFFKSSEVEILNELFSFKVGCRCPQAVNCFYFLFWSKNKLRWKQMIRLLIVIVLDVGYFIWCISYLIAQLLYKVDITVIFFLYRRGNDSLGVSSSSCC